ncbi:MAG: hypothetical protein JWL59_5154 [Chthoniobacteraceae bacterium]|nr:hypothetical protein [Chthoniobacteraceae bacterium]
MGQLEHALEATTNSSRHSCLYECSVMHHRLSPRQHRFSYRLFYLCIDLDEIDGLDSRLIGFSRNRWNLYSFRDRDHLTLTGGTIKENLIVYLKQSGIDFPEGGRAVLITLPRVLGYIFNPISFYYCFNAQGEPFCAVAQVGNTFGEMKPYLLPHRGEANLFHLVTPKHFYVSPFSGLEVKFDFRLRVPDEFLAIKIDDIEGSQRILLSTLTGRRVALTSARLAWFALKYPFLTLRVIFLIHWEAFLLWLKRIPFHSKAANAHLQQGVLNPHSSIAEKNR